MSVYSGFSNRLRPTSNPSPPFPNSRAVERFDQLVHIRGVREIARDTGSKNSSVVVADARDRKPGLARIDNRFANRLEVLGGRAFPQRADRKSTRLNSSHLGISYAVFC